MKLLYRKSIFILITIVLAFIFNGGVYTIGQTTEQIDPFYTKLLESGKSLYDTGKYSEAIKSFEIAAFGLAEYPSRLLESYIYLTVCHYEIKEAEKSKHYQDEIKNLALKKYNRSIRLPKSLMDKYNEIDPDFLQLEQVTKPSPSTSTMTKTHPPTTSSQSKTHALKTEAEKLKESNNNNQNTDNHLSSIEPRENGEAGPSQNYLDLARAEENTKKKLKYYKQALKNDPADIDAALEMCGVYMEEDKHKEAAKVLEPLLTMYPENMQIYEKLGKIYFNAKAYDKAIDIINQANSPEINNLELSYILGKAYIEVKKYEEAVDAFRIVIERDRDYKNAAYFYYLCLGKISKYENQGHVPIFLNR